MQTWNSVNAKLLTHGIHLQHKINLEAHCTDVVYCNETKEFIFLIPDGYIFRVRSQQTMRGFKQQIALPFSKFLCVSNRECFVGWNTNSREFQILNISFQIISTIAVKFSIIDIIYFKCISHIIVLGTKEILRYEIGEDGSSTLAQVFDAIPENLQPIDRCVLANFRTYPQVLIGISSFYHGFMVDMRTENVVSCRLNLHPSQITALFFHSVLKLVFTGDRKGRIHGWDEEWNAKLKFEGPDDITFLGRVPNTSDILAIGQDTSLMKSRITVWNCVVSKQIQAFTLNSLVTCVAKNTTQKQIAMFAEKIVFWQVTVLHVLHYHLSAPCFILHTERTISNVWRTFAITQESVIHMISPESGEQLTYLCLPTSKIDFIAYSCILDMLFLILLDQRKVVANHCDKRPMKAYKVWTFPETRSHITSVTIYEEINSYFMKRSQSDPILEKVFMVLGFRDGKISLMRPNFDRGEHSLKCHETCVTFLNPYPPNKILISCDESGVIKIWKVSFISEHSPLIPSTTIYCPCPVSHIKLLNTVICMVLRIKPSDDNLLMYDMITNDRWVHKKHQTNINKLINSITTNEILKLCATSTSDGCIQIYDDHNRLLKVLDLRTVPSLISFSSPKGDITISVGTHLCKIHHAAYMHYCTQIQALIEESADPQKEDVVLSESDKNNSEVHSLHLKGGCSPQFDISEFIMKNPLRKEKIDKFQARNNDILNLINGKHSKKGNVLSRKIREKKQMKVRTHEARNFSHKDQVVNSKIIFKMREQQKRNIKYWHDNYKKVAGKNLLICLSAPYWPQTYYMPRLDTFIPNSVAFRLMGIISSECLLSDQQPFSFISEEYGLDNEIWKFYPQERTSYKETNELETLGELIHIYKHDTRKSMERETKFSKGIKGIQKQERKPIKQESKRNKPSIVKKHDFQRKSCHNPSSQQNKSIKKRTCQKNLEVKMKTVKTDSEKASNKSEKSLEDIESNNFVKSFQGNFLNSIRKTICSPQSFVQGSNEANYLQSVLKGSINGNENALKTLYLLGSTNNANFQNIKQYILNLLENIGRILGHYDDSKVCNILKIIETLELNDKEIIAGVLVHSICHRNLRNLFDAYFFKIGLNDPFHVLKDYCDDWNASLITECTNIDNDVLNYGKAFTVVKNWLQHWMDTLECHTNITLEILMEEDEIYTEANPLLLNALERIIKRSKDTMSKRIVSEMYPFVRELIDIKKDEEHKTMTVFVDQSLYGITKYVRPIEALNYFCEVHRKERVELKSHAEKYFQLCLPDIQKIPERKLNASMKAHEPWQIFIHKPLSVVLVGEDSLPSNPTLRT